MTSLWHTSNHNAIPISHGIAFNTDGAGAFERHSTNAHSATTIAATVMLAASLLIHERVDLLRHVEV